MPDQEKRGRNLLALKTGEHVKNTFLFNLHQINLLNSSMCICSIGCSACLSIFPKQFYLFKTVFGFPLKSKHLPIALQT